MKLTAYNLGDLVGVVIAVVGKNGTTPERLIRYFNKLGLEESDQQQLISGMLQEDMIKAEGMTYKLMPAGEQMYHHLQQWVIQQRSLGSVPMPKEKIFEHIRAEERCDS